MYKPHQNNPDNDNGSQVSQKQMFRRITEKIASLHLEAKMFKRNKKTENTWLTK